MKNYVIAKRIKIFSRNFALYQIDSTDTLNVVDENGRPTTTAKTVIGVDTAHFTGWAKGKTGKHSLSETNTEQIIIGTLRVLNDGKVMANDWHLVNQDEINKLYSQRVQFNI